MNFGLVRNCIGFVQCFIKNLQLMRGDTSLGVIGIDLRPKTCWMPDPRINGESL
jgi:hypothetical protein